MKQYEAAMNMALNAGEKFLGATAPEPAAGAIALDKNNKTLLGAATQSNQDAPAEVKLLDLAKKLGKLKDIQSLVLTREPTLATAKEICKNTQISNIVIGTAINNEAIEFFKKNKRTVIEGICQHECQFFLRSYLKKIKTGSPYVTLVSGVIGCQSKPELIYWHQLRKRADAIWLHGSIIADQQEQFSHIDISWIPDHPHKRRILLVSDPNGAVPQGWAKNQKNYTVHFVESLEESLQFLAKHDCIEVLVETNTEFEKQWMQTELWDESIVIDPSEEDSVDVRFRNDK